MDRIPTGLLLPLRHLTKQPKFEGKPPSDHVYGPLEPFLGLFLAGNALSIVPAELFELQGLRVLSLRHNRLTEIPASLRKLTLLQDLNIGGNQLKYLPFELLGLMEKGDLRQLTVRPNPFVTLDKSNIREWNSRYSGIDLPPEEAAFISLDYESTVPSEAWLPALVATGHLHFFDAEGNPTANTRYKSSFMTVLDESHSPHASRVPSLRELTLRSFSDSPYFSRFLDLESDDCPELVLRLLQKAKAAKECGGQTCTVCFRDFVIPRVQWVEWWDCEPNETEKREPRLPRQLLRPLPFLRKGCSWLCIPEGNKRLVEIRENRKAAEGGD